MSAHTTLQQALDAAARSSSAVHYVGSDGHETRIAYAQLRERAMGLLGVLQRRGMRAGDELLLMTDDLAAFVDVFWACVLGGIIVVPLAGGNGDEQRLKALRVLEKLARPHLLLARTALVKLASAAAADGTFPAAAAAIAARAICLEDITDLATPGTVVAATPDDIAFVQYSSGSTGAPKGVTLTHRNLLTNIEAMLAGIDSTRAKDSSLSWMPLTHDMGLVGFHLGPVVARASHWLMTPALFVRRPMLWLQKISEHRVAVTCSPNFGYKHLLKSFNPAAAQGLDLASLRVVVNGAEPISAALCHEFLAALAPFGLGPNVMLPVYGLAEASLAVTFPPLGRALATLALSRAALGAGDAVVRQPAAGGDAVAYVKVGVPVADCELRVADSEGAACASGVVGRVLIRGDNVTRGYYRDPELTAATLSADGWLDTGDLGVVIDGELVITGRAKDVVFVAGRSHYPQDLEAILARDAGIELGRAAVVGICAQDGVSDDIVVFVVHKVADLATFLPQRQRTLRALAEHAGIAVREVIPVRTLPKTTSGKLQRYLLADEFAAGKHAQVSAALAAVTGTGCALRPTASTLESELLQICQDMVPGRVLSTDDNLFEAGTSSLALAQIYERVDAAYPGMLEVTDFFDYPTVHTMSHYLSSRIDSAESVPSR